MDLDLRRKVHACVDRFQSGKNLKTNLPKTEKIKLKYLSQPNEELQLDFHGTLKGIKQKRYILVGVHRFSKWPVATVTSGTSSSIAVAFMEQYIITYGIPEKIVTDQGTAFTGRKFRQFCGKYIFRFRV